MHRLTFQLYETSCLLCISDVNYSNERIATNAERGRVSECTVMNQLPTAPAQRNEDFSVEI